LNRDQKIQKLAHAIKDYRGKFVPNPDGSVKKWLTGPKPDALKRVVRWCSELSLPVEETLTKVEEFKNYAQFNTWIRGI
jgi:hypothetical protein